jgi:hypothetical protein
MGQPFRKPPAQEVDGCRLVSGRSKGGFKLKGHGTYLQGQKKWADNRHHIQDEA